MNKQPDPEMTDTDNPEWTDAMFRQAKRGTAAGRVGRPVGSNKVSTTVRFDKDVIDAFKRGGPGWQTRMNEVLRQYVEQNPVT